ncbi:DUF6406 domain-containing protein [Streptomyces sp. NPDC096136]|uniref:DUF6406 domain-containing protein n=1 Tax=Streptomyces sp. NPDC096136 TaxID=3366076 RepID=UPI003829A1B4
MINEVRLWHGTSGESDNGWFAVIYVYAPPGGPLTVRLVVDAAGEQKYTLGVGDTFPVLNETWMLDRVDNPESDDWVVILRKAH